MYVFEYLINIYVLTTTKTGIFREPKHAHTKR